MRFHNFSQATNSNESCFNLLAASTSFNSCCGVCLKTALRLFRTLAQELLTLLQTGHTNIEVFSTQRHVCCLAVNNCTCFALGTGCCNFCGLRFLKCRQDAFKFTHTTLVLSQTGTNLLRRIVIDLRFRGAVASIVDRSGETLGSCFYQLHLAFNSLLDICNLLTGRHEFIS